MGMVCPGLSFPLAMNCLRWRLSWRETRNDNSCLKYLAARKAGRDCKLKHRAGEDSRPCIIYINTFVNHEFLLRIIRTVLQLFLHELQKKILTLNELESSYSENASTRFKHLGRKEEKS